MLNPKDTQRVVIACMSSEDGNATGMEVHGLSGVLLGLGQQQVGSGACVCPAGYLSEALLFHPSLRDSDSLSHTVSHLVLVNFINMPHNCIRK